MNKYFAPKTQTRNAIRQIMLTCIKQIEENILHINQDIEFLHQSRVSLRQLHTAIELLIKLFPEMLSNEQFIIFYKEVKLYESNLGKARDWDVFSKNTLPQITSQLEPNNYYKNIQKHADAMCRKSHRQMLKFIDSRQQLWTDFKNWLNLDASMPNNDLALSPITQISCTLLQNKHKKLRSKLSPKKISENEQHKLRIFVKKYHYTLNFFAHFYKKKHINKYLKNLKQVQDILGLAHDYTVMAQLCDELLIRYKLASTGYAMAMGKILGYQTYEIKRKLCLFDKTCHKLRKLKLLTN